MKRKWIIAIVCCLMLGVVIFIFASMDAEEPTYKGEIIYRAHVGGTWTNTLYLELYDSGYLAVHDPNSNPWAYVDLEAFVQDHGEHLVYSEFLSEDTFQEILAMMAQLPEEYNEDGYIFDATEATILYKGQQHRIILHLEGNELHEQFIQHLLTIADQRYWVPVNER